MSLPGMEPHPSSPYPVAVPTELPRLLAMYALYIYIHVAKNVYLYILNCVECRYYIHTSPYIKRLRKRKVACNTTLWNRKDGVEERFHEHYIGTGRRLITFTIRQIWSQGKRPSTHWLRGWVDSIARRGGGENVTASVAHRTLVAQLTVIVLTGCGI
jgi:hypothetical protein